MNIETDQAIHRAFDGARILVTGGAGFIAGHLTNALLDLGADVVLVDTLHPRVFETIGNGVAALPVARERRQPSFCELTVGTEAFRSFFQDKGPFDYIFHLAARAYAAASVDTPYLDFTTNLVATIDLLEQMRKQHSRSRLIFASSAAVYGDPAKLPIEESDVTVPISPYGVSKLAAERYIAVYSKLYQLSAASLRLFSVYGPQQRKQVVYDLFAKLHASPHELLVIGDGQQMRDMVYVADVVRAFLVVAACGSIDGFAYNVASGIATSTGDLARMIIRAQGSDAAIRFTEQTRPGDPERWQGSCAPLAAIGGMPIHTLEQGLAATARWFNTTVAEQAQELVV